MRKLLLLLLASIPAFAQYNGNAPLVVQSYTDPAFTAPNGFMTFPGAVASGNMEFVCISVDRGIGGGAAGPYAVTSGNVPAWTASGVLHYTAPGVRHAFDQQCFYGTSTSSGTETVTATGLGGTFVEYSGVEVANVTSVVDVSGSNTVNSTAPASISVGLTTSIDGDLILAASSTSAGQGAADCGFASSPSEKVVYNFENNPYSFGSLIQMQRGTTHGSFTMTRNNYGCTPGDNPADGLTMLAFAFKPVSSGVKVASTILADADTAHAYGGCLQAVGGGGTKTWTVSAGALPTGISLSSSGCFSGTASAALGAYAFTAQVTDGTSATQALIINVVNPFTSPIVTEIKANTAGLGANLSAVLAGDAILVLTQGFDTHGAGGWIQPLSAVSNNISDTFGDTYYRVCPGGDGQNAPIVAYVAKANSSGSNIVTFTQNTSASNLTWFALDITGGSYVVDCGTNDAQVVLNGTSVTVSTSITTAVVNELLVAFEAGTVPTSDNWGSFSKISSISFGTANAYGAVATSNATTAGSYSVSDTLSLASNGTLQGGLVLIGIRPDSTVQVQGVGEKLRRFNW